MSNPNQPAPSQATAPWSEQDLIDAVEAGPKGPHIGAFFDFDGTLIDGYSLSAFARHHLRSLRYRRRISGGCCSPASAA